MKHDISYLRRDISRVTVCCHSKVFACFYHTPTRLRPSAPLVGAMPTREWLEATYLSRHNHHGHCYNSVCPDAIYLVLF